MIRMIFWIRCLYAKIQIVVKILEIKKKINLHFSRFFLNILGPKRFKKLRQACRKNFHLVAPLKNGVVTSYDQECKKINEY